MSATGCLYQQRKHLITSLVSTGYTQVKWDKIPFTLHKVVFPNYSSYVIIMRPVITYRTGNGLALSGLSILTY